MDGINYNPDFRFPIVFSNEALRDGINQRKIKECIQSVNSCWYDVGQGLEGVFIVVIGFSNDNLPIKTRIYLKFGHGFSENDVIEVNDAARPTQEELKRYWCR